MAGTSPSHTYDVFLNFRGEDTRYGFIGHLHKTLRESGIYDFIDNEDLPRGEKITPRLMEAIEKSRIAITVLSENYASSSFCLNELTHIMDRESKKLLVVIPVFYKVRPCDVRHKEGSYKEALDKHAEKFPEKIMMKWKNALVQIANTSGYDFKDGVEYEHEFIKKIVERVSSEINPSAAEIHVADYPVGLESQVLDIRKLLEVGSDDVQMIGIYGMGGVGKSTLAQAVYDLLTNNFECSCFLENVREESNKHGLKHLQSIFLSQLLGKNEINLTSERQGTSMIQNRLKRKKALIILDDVDKHKQLQGIVGRPECFCSGSIIIITTRDKQLLASYGVETTYKVEGIEDPAARQLLTWKAFRKDKADPSYEEVLNRVVTYASGLPLALEVIGSNLFEKTINEWESAIKTYERIPNNQIQEILKVSFDTLGDEEKRVFLDIACCMEGYESTKVEEMLCALYDHSVEYHIGVLEKKSLIKIGINGRVELHNLVKDMGKAIDRQESPKEPGRRRRLWAPKDIIQVLRHNTGTSEIEIIRGNFPKSHEEEKVEWNQNAFKQMKNLKILIISNGNFSEPPNYLPESLKILAGRETWFPSKELAIYKQLKSLEFGSILKARNGKTGRTRWTCQLVRQKIKVRVQ